MNSPTIPSIVLITDPGKDSDDELTLTAMAALVRRGVARLVCVVTNLADSSLRARLAKGTLQQVGLGDVPVGVGSDCTKVADPKNTAKMEACPYLADPSEVVADGHQLLVDTLEMAEDGSITLLLISGLTDANRLVTEQPDLFADKVGNIVYMGGGRVIDGQFVIECIDGQTAANSDFDAASSTSFYQKVQELGIPMTIVSRHAVYAVHMPHSAYTTLGETGNPVGEWLNGGATNGLKDLFRRCRYVGDERQRSDYQLPNDGRCNAPWFLNRFTPHKAPSHLLEVGKDGTFDHATLEAMGPYLPEGFDPDRVEDHFTGSNWYDLLATLAIFDELNIFDEEQFVTATVNGVTHTLIGTPTQSGVSDPDRARAIMENLVIEGLTNA